MERRLPFHEQWPEIRWKENVDLKKSTLQAALEMRKGLAELNRERAKKGKRPFVNGIGIHTGDVLAGTVGREDPLSYALIGDTVNLASRIEGMTKKFQCDILVSENTVKRLEKSFDMEKGLPQKVRGYSKPIILFRVSG